MRNKRGVDDPVRSLGEAFPEFYGALLGITDMYQNAAQEEGWHGAEDCPEVVKARAVLKRMKGETP